MNVITGETGSGKSVLMGALDLVLGGRADASVVRDGATEAEVEAFFEVEKTGGGGEKGGKAKRLLISLVKLVVGLGVLIGSSHFLVWGSVDLAKFMGVSDLVIGLTIVAAGTSLPELASAIASARRGEHEFVLGNIIGSNLFNTLAVVGIATAISPLAPGANGEPAFSPYVLTRDVPLMTALSLSITFFGMNWKHPRRPGEIRRKEAWTWIAVFVVYTLLAFWQEARSA